MNFLIKRIYFLICYCHTECLFKRKSAIVIVYSIHVKVVLNMNHAV